MAGMLKAALPALAALALCPDAQAADAVPPDYLGSPSVVWINGTQPVPAESVGIKLPKVVSGSSSAMPAVPPDYVPEKKSAAPQAAAHPAPARKEAPAVPPDYVPGSAPVVTTPRPDLRPSSGWMPLDEQLSLLKRNQEDIDARIAVRRQLNSRLQGAGSSR